MAWDAYKTQRKKSVFVRTRKEKDAYTRTTATELVPMLLDDAIDSHFLDVEDGEEGGAEDVHHSLRDLVPGGCTTQRSKDGRRKLVRTCTRTCLYSPAPVAEGKVKRIGLCGLAGLCDHAIRVEGHWVIVYLGIMHEVPICRS